MIPQIWASKPRSTTCGQDTIRLSMKRFVISLICIIILNDIIKNRCAPSLCHNQVAAISCTTCLRRHYLNQNGLEFLKFSISSLIIESIFSAHRMIS